MSVLRFMAGVLVGGAVGAVLGVLYAPKSGEETREDIKNSAQEKYSKAQDAVRQIQDKADTALEEVQKKGDEIIDKIQTLINKQKEGEQY